MKPTHIIIHHSLTKDSQTVSFDAIKHYHTKVLGWKDIGYHYILERVGKDDFQIFKGRDLNETGAHCKEQGMNHKSIGICCVGNYDEVFPPPMMVDKLIELLKQLMIVFQIPIENIKGHREYAHYKTCPGKEFDLKLIKQRLV
jgi:N-acetyl-anhydromuramyl-L-alanine amidase AmpD